MKRIFIIVKGVIGYLLALILNVIFALFLNANVGWYMLVALILAPVLSVFFALLTKTGIRITTQIESVQLSKGDYAEMMVTIKNKTIFPTTPIELKILNGDGVICTDTGVITNVLPLSEKTITLRYKASICGKSHVGIDKILVTDFLGLMALKYNSDEKLSEDVYVIPDIMKVSPKDERILKVMQESMNADDSEDTRESNFNSFGGFPGYDKRDYVPGDPIKRINWKQSAKKNKLLIRLDDEINANGVNLVIDGYFNREKFSPLIAQDAVEMALGIINVLVLSDYCVHFYVKFNGEFNIYEINDEKDLEELRLILSKYEFSPKSEKRFPDVENYVLVTPNSYVDTMVNNNVSIFSAYEDYKELKSEDEEKADKKKININNLIVPYLLAVTLSVIVFSAFNVSFFSLWTIVQMAFVGALFALCNYAKNHKFIGFLAVSGTVVISLMIAGKLIIPASSFLEWFLSGGDNYDGGIRYMMVILFFLTLFFGLVVYYYTVNQYRTSSLMLISMIAFLVHVKLVRDVKIIQVMIVVSLNVAAFIINNRKKRDEGHKKYNLLSYVLSLVMYSVMFVLLAFAIPKSDSTKYYSEFEDRFLGGNSQVEIPSEYMDSSKYSGNADNIQSLSTRKLYSIKGNGIPEILYLHRCTFDYYDYGKNRWVIYDENYNYGHTYENFEGSYRDYELNLNYLIEGIKKAEEIEPGFVRKYHLNRVYKTNLYDEKFYAEVTTYNFESKFYVLPIRGKVYERDNKNEQENIFVTLNGDYMAYGTKLESDNVYQLEFYDEFGIREEWFKRGGSNYSFEESIEIIDKLLWMEEIQEDDELWRGIYEYKVATEIAENYCKSYEKELNLIPDSVKELAYEITKDCEYDWEKAEALMMYFSDGFKYQLGYVAEDDSVEYFLFESKTGTCSDYASAYVLMARAVGLHARYVEGYATDNASENLEGEVELVVRANDSHAYAEVFIPNYGYAIYDPTLGDVMDSLVREGEDNGGAIVVTYVLTLGARIIIIFAAVSVLLLLIILIVKVFTPMVMEKLFIRKVKKASYGHGVVLLYLRLIDKCSRKIINSKGLTPREFRKEFYDKTGYDIESLVNLVEIYKYMERELLYDDVSSSIEVYKAAIKEYKKI